MVACPKVEPGVVTCSPKSAQNGILRCPSFCTTRSERVYITASGCYVNSLTWIGTKSRPGQGHECHECGCGQRFLGFPPVLLSHSLKSPSFTETVTGTSVKDTSTVFRPRLFPRPSHYPESESMQGPEK